MPDPAQPHVSIACGGTGGHFFPGVAVAHELVHAGARATLFVSEKEVDRQAVATVPEISHLEINFLLIFLKKHHLSRNPNTS